jgi:fumarate hydratase subunit alpha
LRPIGDRHPDPAIAGLELELLQNINKLGIGPQGLGGTTTAFDVHIETYPTHIGSLPLAVNFQCHCGNQKIQGLLLCCNRRRRGAHIKVNKKGRDSCL